MTDKKRVVISGGSGLIGSAIAARFLNDGAEVAIIDIKEPENSKYRFIKTDLSDVENLKQNIDIIIKQMGGVDYLINAAGITSLGSFESISFDEWDRVHNINLRSVFIMCQAVLKPMKEQKSGVIINIGSVLAKNGGNPRPWLDADEQAKAANAAYGASKAGVHSLTLYLAKEMASFGVRVNAIAPGPIASQMTTNFPQSLINQIPLGRMGNAQDIAEAAYFLCSDKAKFITGEIIDINGGLWMD